MCLVVALCRRLKLGELLALQGKSLVEGDDAGGFFEGFLEGGGVAGFDKVVVCAVANCVNEVLLALFGREKDKINVLIWECTNFLAETNAIEFGHVPVADDHVGGKSLDQVPSCLAIRGFRAGVACGFKHLAQNGAGDRFVVADEDMHGGLWWGVRLGGIVREGGRGLRY